MASSTRFRTPKATQHQPAGSASAWTVIRTNTDAGLADSTTSITPKATQILVPAIYTNVSFVLGVLGAISAVLLPAFVWLSNTRLKRTDFSLSDRLAIMAGRLMETVDWATDLALLWSLLAIQRDSLVQALIACMVGSLVSTVILNAVRYIRAAKGAKVGGNKAWKELYLHLPLISAFAVLKADRATLLKVQRTHALYSLGYRAVEDLPQIAIVALLLVQRPIEADFTAFLSLVLSVESFLLACATINGDLQMESSPLPTAPDSPTPAPLSSFALSRTTCHHHAHAYPQRMIGPPAHSTPATHNPQQYVQYAPDHAGRPMSQPSAVAHHHVLSYHQQQYPPPVAVPSLLQADIPGVMPESSTIGDLTTLEGHYSGDAYTQDTETVDRL